MRGGGVKNHPCPSLERRGVKSMGQNNFSVGTDNIEGVGF